MRSNEKRFVAALLEIAASKPSVLTSMDILLKKYFSNDQLLDVKSAAGSLDYNELAKYYANKLKIQAHFEEVN